MRWLLLVALFGCGHPRTSGPKWPEPSKTADDGGESVAPAPSATYAAAIEKSAEASDDKPAAATSSTPSAKPDDDKPATAPAESKPTVEDVFMSEEIIIEIDD